MKQGILPLIPADATDIDGFYSVFNNDTTVTWFHGSYPIRVHPASDHATQRSMIGFLHLHGGVPQPRIAAALRVHENTVRAAVRLLRLKGDAGFYTPTTVRGPAVMCSEIVPRLLLDVPRQPSDVELEADKCIHRFRLIFDRAGCSYKFVEEIWRSFRVACMTYMKSPDADWPETEFRSFTATRANSGTEEMELAEHGTWFGSGGRASGVVSSGGGAAAGTEATRLRLSARTINARFKGFLTMKRVLLQPILFTRLNYLE